MDCWLVLHFILLTFGKAVCGLLVGSVMHLEDCWQGLLSTACWFCPVSCGLLARLSVDCLLVLSCILLTVGKAICGLLVGSVLHLVDCWQGLCGLMVCSILHHVDF